MRSAALLTQYADVEGGAALRLQLVGSGAAEGAGQVTAQHTNYSECAGGLSLEPANHRAESQSHDLPPSLTISLIILSFFNVQWDNKVT